LSRPTPARRRSTSPGLLRSAGTPAPIKGQVEKVAVAYFKHAKARTRESTFTETKRAFDRTILSAWPGGPIAGDIMEGPIMGPVAITGRRGMGAVAIEALR
jgi:hypothetical protein